MAIDPAVVITATGSATAAVIAAWALLTRARGRAGQPMHVLRRIWDWLEVSGHKHAMPDTLRADTERTLGLNEDGEDK